jgi:uncharacterized repeat protein (TIGR01451 family)
VENTVDANKAYAINEVAAPGYIFVSITGDEKCPDALGGTVQLDEGEDITCTITNDDVAPTLTLEKTVVTDDGGTAVEGDFQAYISGDPVDWDSAETLSAGNYTASEDGLFGYTAGDWGGDCDADGDVSLSVGENLTCTITNDDVQPLLTVTKIVESGAAQASDFTLYVEATQVTSGAQNGFDVGDYVVSEDSETGYTGTISGDCDADGNVSLAVGDEKACTITNVRDLGTIVVNKIIDADGDTQTTNDQTPGENWQFDVDGWTGDTTDAPSGVTNASGSSTFADLRTGEYTVIETLQEGYDLIDVSCDNQTGSFDNVDSIDQVEVEKDSTTTCTFVNAPNGVLHGRKYHDENANGEEPEFDEDLLSGWTINLYKYDDQENDYLFYDSFVTDDDQHFGWYWFENLFPGDYKICEELQTGWEQTYPLDAENDNCHLVSLPEDTSATSINEEILNAVTGPAYDFGNVEYGSVLVTKYSDDNGNGQRDEGEDTLSGWTMNLDELSDITDGNGEVLFENLLPGFYTLSEDLQDGWILTGISCEEGEQGQTDNEFLVPVTSGQTISCEVGNLQEVLGVSIEKSNDSPASSAGATVTYTLTVTNDGNTPILGVDIIDVLPGEFTYVSGSTSGDTISDPTITAGKLTWENVGDLGAGESFTISYQATIASDAADATYTNIATCQAFSRTEEEIECNVVTSDVTLGTGVTLSASVGGQVLGAATELPAAGSNTALLYIFIGMILGGFGLRVHANDLEEKKGKKNA